MASNMKAVVFLGLFAVLVSGSIDWPFTSGPHITGHFTSGPHITGHFTSGQLTSGPILTGPCSKLFGRPWWCKKACSLGTIKVDDFCRVMICDGERMVPYNGSTAPDIAVKNLIKKGCIHVEETEMNFYDARKNCQRLGGDLFVAGDLKMLLFKVQPAEKAWVGVKNQAWLDGRQVTMEEWDTNNNQPNGDPDFCGNVDAASTGVEVAKCSDKVWSICHIGVTYSTECDDCEFDVDDNCAIVTCKAGLIVPYEGFTYYPGVDFSKLVAKNCIHLNKTEMNFTVARQNCQNLGGDLFVAGDLNGMGQYFRDEGVSVYTFVGMKYRAWLNGRPVVDEEWDPNDPDGDKDQCGVICMNHMQVKDVRCSSKYYSLCQIGVTHPIDTE